MEMPEWYPVVALVESKRLSGPIPARAVLHDPCDPVMSQLELAPFWVAQKPVPPGHGLETPMTFWSAICATGTSSGSIASIPMGAWGGSLPTPWPRESGHAEDPRTAGTATRELDEEILSSWYTSINLTRAFSWVRYKMRRDAIRTIPGRFRHDVSI